MKNSALFWLISASAFALAACTQNPAQVVYKGDEFFGREHEGTVNSSEGEDKTFDENSPRYKPGYAHPVTDAAVPSVGVSDLPPPAQVASGNVQSNDLAAPKPGKKDPLQPHFLTKSSDNSVEVQDQPIAGEKAEKATPVPAHKAITEKADSKFIWPVEGGKIISHFDANAKQDGKGNDGINIAMAEGEPIFAAADGVVVYAGSELQGYGNMVILKHADGWMTAYAHARSLSVKKGDKVKQSDLIAYVGSTGGVKTPQVHFVLRKDKMPVNPEKYLPHNG